MGLHSCGCWIVEEDLAFLTTGEVGVDVIESDWACGRPRGTELGRELSELVFELDAELMKGVRSKVIGEVSVKEVSGYWGADNRRAAATVLILR